MGEQIPHTPRITPQSGGELNPQRLNSSADNILQNYSNELADISDYSFTKQWIDKIDEIISRIKESDGVDIGSVIVKNDIGEYLSIRARERFWLGNDKDFSHYDYNLSHYKTSSDEEEEKDYLDNVFLHNYKGRFFDNYKNLFLPYENDGNIIVLKLGFKNGW